MKPIAREYDHADRYPSRTVEQMKELGLFGATISQEYGGLGLPAGTYAKIVMRISRDGMAVTGISNSHLMLALAIVGEQLRGDRKITSQGVVVAGR